MNHIPFPNVDGAPIDDNHVIYSLARNNRISIYPALLYEETMIMAAYTAYVGVKGDAKQIAPIQPACGDALRTLYESTYRTTPPKDLLALKAYRKQNADLVCPMCGSFRSGTLDHVLPKVHFPEFSIFSLNLVPACICNSLRKEKTTGIGTERILHPYFDTVLSNRLIRMVAAPPYETPEISIAVLLDENDKMFKAVHFHVKHVVAKTGIVRHLVRRWAQLMRKPSLVLPMLPESAVSINELKDVISAELERLDQFHESKNNWDSIFVAGLQDQEIANFLLQHISNPAPVVL